MMQSGAPQYGMQYNTVQQGNQYSTVQQTSQYNTVQNGGQYNTVQQSVVVTQPGMVAPAVVPVIQHRNWMVHSILVCLFCFWPTGIPAIIFSKKANDAARFGDVAGATSYANSAKTFVIISLVVGICWIVVVVIVRVILTVLVYT